MERGEYSTAMDDKVKIKNALGCVLSSFALGMALIAVPLASAASDHDEYDATLHAPYVGQSGERRELTLTFFYPGQPVEVTVAWRVEIRDDQNTLVRSWSGQAIAGDVVRSSRISWDGTDARGDALPDGNYQASLFTSPGDADNLAVALAAADVVDGPALMVDPPIIQTWPLRIGEVFPVEMPSFAPLPSASRSMVSQSSQVSADLPYTVYYGNLHSQTNHSDGGGVIGSCTGAQNPQSGAFDPADAFAYAYSHGLDALIASEHNHMYDGSNGTNAGANPAVAQALYQSGLQQASSFTQSHPGFLALYGMEWGVINNGGHLNIFGSDDLYSWEYNGSGQLIGDQYTPKSDYLALYETLRSRNALGQFNHPATSGQFRVGGVDLGYDAIGDATMVLAEVLNSSAFSSNTTETETSRTLFEGAWKKLLERGYHVAPSSNQDNHCANWGASYTNRSGILLPMGLPLSNESFMVALQARRVFATMDKTAQLILISPDNIMGARIRNAGTLSLTALYASTSGRVVSQVQLFEGVPGRNGTVTLAASAAQVTLSPSPGEHFYYAKVTQDDGKMLWSAPIWVEQLDPADAIFMGGFGQWIDKPRPANLTSNHLAEKTVLLQSKFLRWNPVDVKLQLPPGQNRGDS